MSRCRPLARFALVGLVLGAGWVVFESIRASRLDPVIAVDHRAAVRTRAIAMSGVDPDAADVAWVAMLRAFDLNEAVLADTIARLQDENASPRGEWDVGLVDYSMVRAGDTIPDQAQRERDAIRQFVERGGEDALAAFARATIAIAPPEPPPPGQAIANPMDTIVFPELARARNMARTLAAVMRIAHEEGELARVASAFDELLALARTISYQPGLIGHLVGQAILALALDELNQELAEQEVGEMLCDRLLQVLDRRKLAPIELAIEAERALFDDMMQRTFTDDGNGDGLLAEDNIAGAAIARFFGPERAKVSALADDYFDKCVASARLTPVERAARGFSHVSFVSNLGFSASNRFSRTLLPEMDRYLAQADHVTTRVDGARLMLAIEVYQARHGKPPNTLADLTPEILARIPTIAATGDPFEYALTEDGADFVLTAEGDVLNRPRPAWPE